MKYSDTQLHSKNTGVRHLDTPRHGFFSVIGIQENTKTKCLYLDSPHQWTWAVWVVTWISSSRDLWGIRSQWWTVKWKLLSCSRQTTTFTWSQRGFIAANDAHFMTYCLSKCQHLLPEHRGAETIEKKEKNTELGAASLPWMHCPAAPYIHSCGFIHFF